VQNDREHLVQKELGEVCAEVLESIVVVPDVCIENISVRCFRSARFDSSQERTTFVVCIHTNDAPMVRGDSNLYKGSYKERIEAVLDFRAKSLLPKSDVHLEINGPETGSVERLVPTHRLIRAGTIAQNSPIAETARLFSIPDILIRGRHLIAPSPTIADYLAGLVQKERIKTAIDLFGGTGLVATVLCKLGNPTRVTVVERENKTLDRMKEHLKDERVNFVHGDAFDYQFGVYDLIVADPYYEDAVGFLKKRLDAVLNSTRIFLFVPGKIEDVAWNYEVERELKRGGTDVVKFEKFGQVLFDVRS
jgi:hypothetical protein